MPRTRLHHQLAFWCLVPIAVVAGVFRPATALGQESAPTATGVSPVVPSESTRTSLTSIERQRADAWQLTESEWRRYRQFMLGIRGSVSQQNLSPIEVLGIHARDDAERREYARRWAEAMRDDAERVLAFQHAYDAAAEQLFGGQPLIDAGRLKTVSPTTSALQADDRLLFFTETDCPACEAMLVKLLNHLITVAGIDIYFTDLAAGSDARIRQWAGEHGIDPDWVHQRRVTLNVDAGLLDTLSDDVRHAPAVFRRRQGALSPLKYADL